MFNPSDLERKIEDTDYTARNAARDAESAQNRADEAVAYTRTEVTGLNESISQTDEMVAELKHDLLQLQEDFAKFRAEWEASKK